MHSSSSFRENRSSQRKPYERDNKERDDRRKPNDRKFDSDSKDRVRGSDRDRNREREPPRGERDRFQDKRFRDEPRSSDSFGRGHDNRSNRREGGAPRDGRSSVPSDWGRGRDNRNQVPRGSDGRRNMQRQDMKRKREEEEERNPDFDYIVPRSNKYFQHDDREDFSRGPRGGGERWARSRQQDEENRSWKHDLFETSDAKSHNNNGNSSAPRTFRESKSVVQEATEHSKTEQKEQSNQRESVDEERKSERNSRFDRRRDKDDEEPDYNPDSPTRELTAAEDD